MGPQTGLDDFLSGETDGEYPDGMAAAGSALVATALMVDGAMEQRAAQGIGEIGEALKDSLDPRAAAFVFHYI